MNQLNSLTNTLQVILSQSLGMVDCMVYICEFKKHLLKLVSQTGSFTDELLMAEYRDVIILYLLKYSTGRRSQVGDYMGLLK